MPCAALHDAIPGTPVVTTPSRKKTSPAMDTQRLILFFVFSFSLLMLWEAWQKENRPAAQAVSQSVTAVVPSPAPPVSTPAGGTAPVPAAATPAVRPDAVPGAVTAPTTATAKDAASGRATGNLTAAQESSAMPMPGQVNNHSTTALDAVKRGASAP